MATIKNSKLAGKSARVIAPPPLIFLSGIILGLILRLILPLPNLASPLSIYLGVALIGLSLAIFTLSLKQFARVGTSVEPHKPTTAIIRQGPYRFSRNPIYLAMIVLYLGIGAIFGDPWFIALLIPLIWLIQNGVVRREEAYLEKKFGRSYLDYKNSTSRWLF